MKILILWPPQVPSYFNAGHHLTVFTTAAYLRSLVSGVEVRAVDAGALNATWKDIGDLLIQQYDVLAVANDFDGIDTLSRLIYYARSLSPEMKIVTFGRLSNRIPEFFTRFDLDAVVAQGDPEVGVAVFVEECQRGKLGALPGVYVRSHNGNWQRPSPGGKIIPAEKLPLPDVREIPYDAYDRMYRNDLNKFCGIPERRELVVPVSRGCPIQCEFCDVPIREGIGERRISVPRMLTYVEQCMRATSFDYVAMYAPTFTLRKPWVYELCRALTDGDLKFKWKCTTTLSHLDEELIQAMAAAGCVRISVGLETLESLAQELLPKHKQMETEAFERVARWCEAAQVELNCFVILGLPGTTLEGARHTAERVEAVGGRLRPTIYTDYHKMQPDMDEEEIASFNRHLFRKGEEPPHAVDLYRIYFNSSGRVTQVMEKIPKAF